MGRHELLLLRLKAAVLAASGSRPAALHVLGGCRRRLAQDGSPGRAAQEAQVGCVGGDGLRLWCCRPCWGGAPRHPRATPPRLLQQLW
jgi:hypothetical protein